MLGWELPPHNSGGLGVACMQLCRALSRQNIDIDFIIPYKADHGIDFMNIISASPQNVSSILKSGIAYDSYKYVMNDGREEWHDIFDQQSMYEVAVGRIAEKRAFNIIHAHDWLTFRAALRAKELSGKPLIVHAHSIESDRAGGNRGNPMVHEIEHIAFHSADRIIAVSEFTRQAIARDYGIPEQKIDVVHNSIDRDDLVDIDMSVSNAYTYLNALHEQGYRIVTNIGRLTIQKGLTNLLHAARMVIDKEPKTLFLIVGNGEQYIELIELAADLGISKNIIFTGFQRGKAWRDAFSIADLFILPSVSEPFGLTPLEAAFYGTPSLISKQSGVAEILKHSLKVDYWDIHEMANQIIAVMQNDTLRDEIIDNAKAEVNALSWNHSANKLCNLYHQFASCEIRT